MFSCNLCFQHTCLTKLRYAPLFKRYSIILQQNSNVSNCDIKHLSKLIKQNVIGFL